MRNGRFTLLAFVVVAAATSGVVACATRSAPAPTPGPTAASDRVGQFVWQDLMTDEAEKSVAFYEQLLGWTFERTTRLGKPYFVARAGSSPVAGIAQVERRRPDEPIAQWISYLSVADVDAVAARVPGSGGRVLVAPTDVAASRAAIAVDPQGAAFGLVKLGPNLTLPIGGASAPVGTFFWRDYLAQDVDKARTFYVDLAALEAERQTRPDLAPALRPHAARAGPRRGHRADRRAKDRAPLVDATCA